MCSGNNTLFSEYLLGRVSILYIVPYGSFRSRSHQNDSEIDIQSVIKNLTSGR